MSCLGDLDDGKELILFIRLFLTRRNLKENRRVVLFPVRFSSSQYRVQAPTWTRTERSQGATPRARAFLCGGPLSLRPVVRGATGLESLSTNSGHTGRVMWPGQSPVPVGARRTGGQASTESPRGPWRKGPHCHRADSLAHKRTGCICIESGPETKPAFTSEGKCHCSLGLLHLDVVRDARHVQGAGSAL